MPLLMTDIAAGQKAALDIDLEPLRAQAEREKIPLGVEQLRQNLETGKLQHQASTFKLQSLLKEEEENTQFKSGLDQLIKSGQFDVNAPISTQTKKLSELAYGKGNFELGMKFTKMADTATQHEDQAENTRSKVEQRKLSQFGTSLRMLASDGSNLDDVINDAINTKLFAPKQLEGLRQQGKQAIINGPGAYQAWVNDTAKKFRTHEQAVLDQKIAYDAVREKQLEQRHTEMMARIGRSGERGQAARQNGDDRAARTSSINNLRDLRRNIDRIGDDIRSDTTALQRLPAKPGNDWLGRAVEDPNKDARDMYTDRIKNYEKRQKDYLEQEKETVEELKTLGVKFKKPAKETPAAPPATGQPNAGATAPAKVEDDLKAQDGSPAVVTAGRDIYTHREITVKDERINENKFVNIPTIYNGKIVTNEEAVQLAARAIAEGKVFRGYDNKERAEQVLKEDANKRLRVIEKQREEAKAGGAASTYTQSNPANPKDKAEYDKLPPGSYYRQDGVLKRKAN